MIHSIRALRYIPFILSKPNLFHKKSSADAKLYLSGWQDYSRDPNKGIVANKSLTHSVRAFLFYTIHFEQAQFIP